MYRHQNSVQNHNIKITNKSFENMKKLKCTGVKLGLTAEGIANIVGVWGQSTEENICS